MSRRSFPRIDPAALRDHADEARVDRIWERIDQDLGSRGEAARARRSAFATLAVAAAFGAFGAGLLVGKVTWDRRAPVATALVTPDADKSVVEVLAAGSQLRTFPLKGGGRLTLSPGATAEVERTGGALTVSLLQGQASLDAAGRKEIAVVAGAARIEAQAGAVLSVTRNADDLDVKVDDGAATVTSPAGRQELGKNERAPAVPIRAAVASAPVDDAPRTGPAVAARRPNAQRPATAKVAGQPEWFTRTQANDEEGALALLRKVGVDQAIGAARNASELMAIADLMRHRGRDQAAAVRALRRVVESFQGDHLAHIAAGSLAEIYKGDPLVEKEYRDKAQLLAKMGDASFCNLIDHEHDKDEAAKLAKDYLSKYPNGQCHARIKERVQAEEPPAEGAPAALPPPAAPAP